MLQISVVYHSGYGHTKKVAEAVAEGAKIKDAQVHLIKVGPLSDADWSLLNTSDAIIFGAPTYMGGVSGPFKVFLDETTRYWMTLAWKDKIAAGFTNSGSLSGDKLASLQQLMTTALQHGMIWVGQTEIAPQLKGTDVPGSDRLNRMGSYSGLMTQSNNDALEITPPQGDLETARRFGARVAEVTRRFHQQIS